MPEPDFALVQRLAERARIAGSGGGPHDGGMLEQRVAALEADMREVKSILARMEPLLRSIDTRLGQVEERLRKLEVETAELKGRVSQLPNVWQLLVGGFGLVAFVFGVVRCGLPR